MPLLALLLLSCAAEADPCPAMCEAAAPLVQACLEAEGLDWGAAGYADEAAFLESCETWAWQARLLERDAGQEGAVDATCQARAEDFTAAMADPEAPDCAAWTAVTWEEMPW